jgi:hypothetical protein
MSVDLKQADIDPFFERGYRNAGRGAAFEVSRYEYISDQANHPRTFYLIGSQAYRMDVQAKREPDVARACDFWIHRPRAKRPMRPVALIAS